MDNKDERKHALIKTRHAAHVIGVIRVAVLGVEANKPIGRRYGFVELVGFVVGVNNFQLALFTIAAEGVVFFTNCMALMALSPVAGILRRVGLFRRVLLRADFFFFLRSSR